MTRRKIPTTIVAQDTNDNFIYKGIAVQLPPVPAPVVEAPVVDEMTGLSDAPSIPATIFKYTYFGITDEVVVDQTTYQENGALALVMLDAHNKQLVTVISINVPEIALQEGEIIVKTYSENLGMDLWLANNEIAAFTGMSVQLPHGNVCPIMKLL